LPGYRSPLPCGCPWGLRSQRCQGEGSMSEDVRRRALLTAGLALGAMPLVQGLGGSPAQAASDEPLIGPATGDDIHVMSFNIRVPVDASPHSWADRRPLIRDLLRRERPTLIGTQEG